MRSSLRVESKGLANIIEDQFGSASCRSGRVDLVVQVSEVSNATMCDDGITLGTSKDRRNLCKGGNRKSRKFSEERKCPKTNCRCDQSQAPDSDAQLDPVVQRQPPATHSNEAGRWHLTELNGIAQRAYDSTAHSICQATGKWGNISRKRWRI